MMLPRLESTARLVHRAAAGQTAAFGVLVERYQNLVHGTLLARLGRVADGEDLAQNVFLKAYENLSALMEPAKFGAWLRRIAENEATTYLRRRQTRTRYAEEVPLPQAAEAPDAAVERDQTAAAVWEAMAVLSEAERETVLLHYLGQRPQAEVAAWLGISVAGVKARLTRARQRLRDALLDRQVEKALKDERLDKDFRKRVMGALPLLSWPASRPAPLGAWWLGWAGSLVLAVGLMGGWFTTPTATRTAASSAPGTAPSEAGRVRLASDVERARLLDRTRFGDAGIGSFFDSSVLPEDARALEAEALRRGWGGELAWDFDGDDGGWQVELARLGPALRGAVRSRVRDGVLRVDLPQAAGLLPTVILRSPELGYESRLFDRLRVRFRALRDAALDSDAVDAGAADSGAVALMWTNPLNRMFPGADPRRWERRTAPTAERAWPASRFEAWRRLAPASGWREVEVPVTANSDPAGTAWLAELVDVRVVLYAGWHRDADDEAAWAPATAFEIDRIALEGGRLAHLQELPVPEVVRPEPHGDWYPSRRRETVPYRGLTAPLAGDLDGDGDVDLVIAIDAIDAAAADAAPGAPWRTRKGWLTVYNHGAGRFAAGDTVTIETRDGGSSSIVRLYGADIDGDGRLDLVVGRALDTYLYLNRDGGRRWEQAAHWRREIAVGAADVDGDGDGDIVTEPYVPADERVPGEPADGPARLRRNDGAGGFAVATVARPGADKTWFPLRLADVDGDGRADLVWQFRGEVGERLEVAVDSDWRDGAWTRRRQAALPGLPESRRYYVYTGILHVGDLDQDGILEAGVPPGVYSVGPPLGLGLRLTDLDGSGRRRQLLPPSVHLRQDPHPGSGRSARDLDGDGLPDLVVLDENPRTGPHLRVLRGRPGQLPAEEGLYPVPSVPTGWTTADVTGDGRPDLVVVVEDLEGAGVVVWPFGSGGRRLAEGPGARR